MPSVEAIFLTRNKADIPESIARTSIEFWEAQRKVGFYETISAKTWKRRLEADIERNRGNIPTQQNSTRMLITGDEKALK